MRQLEKISEQGFGASPVGGVGQSRKWCFGQAFRSERPSGGGLETEVSAPVGEVGRNRKRTPFLLGQAFRVGDWIALLACRLGTWAGP